jgi:hypothetical protein
MRPVLPAVMWLASTPGAFMRPVLSAVMWLLFGAGVVLDTPAAVWAGRAVSRFGRGAFVRACTLCGGRLAAGICLMAGMAVA